MTIEVRPSKWNFKTAGSAGINLDFFATTGGQIVLIDPRRKLEKFDYGGIGAGVGFGLKLPKIGKLQLSALGHSIAGTVAPMPWWNTGKVFMTSGFRGTELSRRDFMGVCMFIEINAGLVEGASATGMLMGMDAKTLGVDAETMLLMGPSMLTVMDLEIFLRQPAIAPKALLVMGGRNIGLQAGAGVAGYAGIVG